jgi:NAD-dependent SIR2 family protein deacetylase
MSYQIQELPEPVATSLAAAREILLGKNVFVLTGAGLSTDSGIPDYRGEGRVARHPMTYDVFMGSFEARQRYWARSYVGWSRIALAQPNPGHFALAKAQQAGRVNSLITQNVDGLHSEAGSSDVIDLHGRLDRVICLGCKDVISRSTMDGFLEELNPHTSKDSSVEFTPDGDAEVEGTSSFQVPSCQSCGGIYKPDVVFFGESVPLDRVEASNSAFEKSDAVLVAGSSLTVNSGFRFARAANRVGKPIVIVNLGPTRADDLASAKIEVNTSIALERLLLD